MRVAVHFSTRKKGEKRVPEYMQAFKLVGKEDKPAEIDGQYCGGWVLADEEGFNLEEGSTLAREHGLMLMQRTLLVHSHQIVEDYREED